jgi:hypothetical protein
MFKELLNDIVSEYISHELNSIWLNLSEKTFFLVAVGRLQLLLDEARSMLVTTKFYYMVEDVLEVVSTTLVRVCSSRVLP